MKTSNVRLELRGVKKIAHVPLPSILHGTTLPNSQYEMFLYNNNLIILLLYLYHHHLYQLSTSISDLSYFYCLLLTINYFLHFYVFCFLSNIKLSPTTLSRQFLILMECSPVLRRMLLQCLMM